MELGALGWTEAAGAAVLLVAAAAGIAAARLLRRRAPARAAADAAWRAETEERIAALERALEQLREDLGALRAARGAAPRYGEAMELARSGIDAEGIASRCGISVAEAELVRSLATRRSPTGG
ncbi:MAG: hypothetical protein Fur0039_00270 [Rhodocyclaceae bacterium]